MCIEPLKQHLTQCMSEPRFNIILNLILMLTIAMHSFHMQPEERFFQNSLLAISDLKIVSVRKGYFEIIAIACLQILTS